MAEPVESVKPAGSRFFLVLGIALVVLLAAGALTVITRRTESKALAEETAAAAIPTEASFTIPR